MSPPVHPKKTPIPGQIADRLFDWYAPVTNVRVVTYFPSLRDIPAKRQHSWAEHRPWQLHLGWSLLLLCWLGMLSASVFGLLTGSKTSGSSVFWLIFWAVTVTVLIIRGWWGGRYPWVYLRVLALLLGPLFLVGAVVFFVLEVVTLGVRPEMVIYFFPVVLCGCAMFGAGILLATPRVRAFYTG
jgi:hypothetical protein